MKKILLISGDPNSINSELIYKSLKKLSKNKKKIYLISNFKLLKSQLKKLNLKLNISIVKNIDQEVKNRNIKLIDIKLKFKEPFRVNQKEASKFVIKSLNLANDIALNNSDVGIINCPIDKKLLKKKLELLSIFLLSQKLKLMKRQCL